VIHLAGLLFKPRFACAALVRLLLHLQEGQSVRLVRPDPDLGPVELAGDVLGIEQQVGSVKIYCFVREFPRAFNLEGAVVLLPPSEKIRKPACRKEILGINAVHVPHGGDAIEVHRLKSFKYFNYF